MDPSSFVIPFTTNRQSRTTYVLQRHYHKSVLSSIMHDFPRLYISAEYLKIVFHSPEVNVMYCRKILSVVLILITALTVSFPRNLVASEDHLIAPSDFQHSMVVAAQARQQQIDGLKDFFASEIGRQVLKQAGITSTKIENALPRLSNDELAQLSLKADMVKSNFAAGYHEHQMITVLIIVLLVVAIVVVVASVD